MKPLIPETEIPPERILGPSRRRSTPHIYSDIEIASILKAARELTSVDGLCPHTYVALFGLLACTGIRISEALNLIQEDIDFYSGIITIRESKGHASRLIPLHSTALEALKSYIAKRDKIYPVPKTKSVFVTEKGDSLKYYEVCNTFREIKISLGWCNTNRGPRIYDLRHSFATKRLLEWYRNGDDVHQKISYLSHYMGHITIKDTYWYLTAVPELMTIAASRFEKFANRKER
jgi:integrase